MGYKSEQFVKPVDENLFCSICHEVFQDPVSCKDGHTFCSECIEQWLQTSKKCPLDNSLITDKLARNYTIKGIVDNLEVYCYCTDETNNEDSQRSEVSCRWTGKLEEVAKHRDVCGFQLVQCTHPNCTVKVQRRKIEEHMTTCELKVMLLPKENKQLKEELNYVKGMFSNSKGSYTWVANLGERKPARQSPHSPVFQECGHRWKLFTFYTKDGFISFYFTWLMDLYKLRNINIPAVIRLSVLSDVPEETPDLSVAMGHTFTKDNDTLEFRNFMKVADAKLPAYSEKGRVGVVCSIQLYYN